MDIFPFSQDPEQLAQFEDTFRFVAFTVIRFTVFCAHALLFGIAAILLFVLRPTLMDLSGERWDLARGRLARRLEGLVQSALLASAVATTVTIVLQAVLVADARGGEFSISSFLLSFETTFGQWHLLRLPLLAALGVLLIRRVASASLAGAGNGRRGPNAVWWVSWGALSLLLLATSTFSGHAAVADPRTVALVNDLVHLAAGAVWLTGIVILAVYLPDTWRGADASDRLQVLAPSVLRFSTVALASFAVLALTGTVNSFLHVGSWADLVDSGYGRTLSLKILVFLALASIGAINHFIVRDRLQRGLEGSSTNAAQVFRRTIATELALGLVVIALTGVLVGLARTRQAVPESVPQNDVSSEARP